MAVATAGHRLPPATPRPPGRGRQLLGAGFHGDSGGGGPGGGEMSVGTEGGAGAGRDGGRMGGKAAQGGWR